jgi:hypothetical protein
MRVQWPAIASSTELSTTSQIRWCKPWRPVEPMYIPGRLRTGSRPSSTWIALASYAAVVAAEFFDADFFPDEPDVGSAGTWVGAASVSLDTRTSMLLAVWRHAR